MKFYENTKHKVIYEYQQVLLTPQKKSTPSYLSWALDIGAILLFLAVFYALWLGSYPLFTPDEGRYSEVAREMVTTGDYITPRMNGVVFLDKPVLYYWLQASSIKFLGLKESAIRMWPVLIGILGCVFVYMSGRQLFNRRTGIISAIILSSSTLYYGGAHYANLDLEVATFVSITLLSFLMATQSKESTHRNRLLLSSYIFAGLAALTKGLIGIFFPFMIIGTWIILLNQWSLLKNIRLFSGIIIFLCITAPWYLLVQQANPQFFHFFFITQQFSRFLTTNTFNNQNVSWFYFPIVFLGFFPWSVFFIQAMLQKVKNVLKKNASYKVELFLMLWVVLIFIFFSIPRSKTIGYILPILPPLALLIGNYLDTQWNNKKNGGIRMGVILYILLCFAGFWGCLFAPHFSFFEVDKVLIPYLTFIGIVFLSSCLLVMIFSRSFIITLSILTSSAIILCLTICASGTALNQKSVKPLALFLKNTIQPDDEVVTYFKYYQDLPMYLEKRITIVANWTEPDIEKNDNWLREFWYGIPFQKTDWLIEENNFWKKWNSDKRLFVLLNAGYYEAFEKKAINKIHKLKQFNDVILVCNQSISSKNPKFS